MRFHLHEQHIHARTHTLVQRPSNKFITLLNFFDMVPASLSSSIAYTRLILSIPFFFITENATCICNVSIFVRFRDRSLQCGAHNNNKQKFVRNCFLCHLLDLLFVCIRKGNKCKYTQKLKAKKKLKFMEINEKIIIE